MIAYDGKDWGGYSSIEKFTVVESTNNSPDKPVLIPPSNGAIVPKNISFTWSCSDPNGDNLTYVFLLGSSPGNYSQSWTKSHPTISLYAEEGDAGKKYYWAVKAYDGELYSEVSEEHSFTFSEDALNNPPDKPTLVSPANGSVFDINYEVIYEANGTDPDGDALEYHFYEKIGSNNWYLWDRTNSSKSKPYVWTNEASVQWKVKTVDEHGAESEFSDVWSYSVVKEENSPPIKPVITAPSWEQTVPLRPSSGNNIFTIEWTGSDPDPTNVLTFLIDIDRSRSGLTSVNAHDTEGNSISLYFPDPKFNYKGEWYCQVFATDGKDTIPSDIVKFYLDWPTAVTTLELSKQITIYPNPVTDFVKIKTDVNLKSARIQLLNLRGRLIKDVGEQKMFINTPLEINTQSISPGIYLIRIISEEKSFCKKIIKN